MTSVEHIRARIGELIATHDPKKLFVLDKLLARWKWQETDLLKTVCEKYGVENAKLKPIPLKEAYSIGPKCGTGGFAIVRRVKRRSDKKIFALKIINKQNLDKEDLEAIEIEVVLMRKISHKNIVPLIDVFDSKFKLCLVLGLLDGGELFDRIIEKGHFSEKDAAVCFEQIASALQYIHAKGIVHRDLKPENLLFEAKDSWVLKLIDFGLSGQVEKGAMLKTPCGTPNYVAPEILRKEPYGPQVDVWSAGVILYILLCGFPPFYDDDDNMDRLYYHIKKAKFDFPERYWGKVSPHAKQLVRLLLQPDPKKRLTSTTALKHPWLKEASPEESISNEALSNLKRFQYIRRIRRGVRVILAVMRLIKALEMVNEKEKKKALKQKQVMEMKPSNPPKKKKRKSKHK